MERSALETQKQELWSQVEQKQKGVVEQLERELREKEDLYQTEKEDMQKLSEESLAQLKSFYETEKERMEREFIRKNDANTKRTQAIQEEYEIRLKDEQNQHEEDLEML